MTRVTLARRTLGAGALWTAAVVASSPMTVQVGGIPQMFANTGVVGVPLSFVVIAGVVALLAVGLVAMARHAPHPAPFYAFLAHGAGPSAGLAAGLVGLLAYTTIHVSLYGLFAPQMAAVGGGTWQAWAGGAWAAVAVLGVLRGRSSTRVFGVFLALELVVIVCFVIVAFAQAAGPIGAQGFKPSSLLVTGAAGALVFAMAACVGVETPAAYGEEARPGALGRAVIAAIVFLGGLYALIAMAYMAWAGGPAGVVSAATDENRQPFTLLGGVFGPGVVVLATMLLGTSILAAMLAFHGAAARYCFAMAREKVLPSSLARTGLDGAPVAASLAHSVITGVVLAGFAASGIDPLVMFTWLSTIGGLAVLCLLVASALAARAFFAAGGGAHESLWVRQIAPVVGSALGVLVVVMMSANLGSILGTPPGSRRPWLVPAMIVAVAVCGLAWGTILRIARRAVWAGIGKGTPDPLTVVDQRLAKVKI